MGDKLDGVEFYRCKLCRRAVSPWDLKEHTACPYCGGAYFHPSNLTMVEKIQQIVKHPKVWEWKNVKAF